MIDVLKQVLKFCHCLSMLHSSCPWIKELYVASQRVSERRIRKFQLAVWEASASLQEWKITGISPMTPFVSGLFGLKSQNVFWDLLCRVEDKKQNWLESHCLPEKKIRWNRILFLHYKNTDSLTAKHGNFLLSSITSVREKKHFLKMEKMRISTTNTGWMRKMSWNSTWGCFRMHWEKSYIWQYFLKFITWLHWKPHGTLQVIFFWDRDSLIFSFIFRGRIQVIVLNLNVFRAVLCRPTYFLLCPIK